MNTNKNKKFNFCIARYWNKEKDDSLCVYTYGSEIFYGTQKEAEDLLKFVLTRNEEEKDYKIFKINT